MIYPAQDGDEDITTLRVPKRLRRKLGLCMNGNEKIPGGLERIIDAVLEKMPEPIPQ